MTVRAAVLLEGAMAGYKKWGFEPDPDKSGYTTEHQPPRNARRGTANFVIEWACLKYTGPDAGSQGAEQAVPPADAQVASVQTACPTSGGLEAPTTSASTGAGPKRQLESEEPSPGSEAKKRCRREVAPAPPLLADEGRECRAFDVVDSPSKTSDVESVEGAGQETEKPAMELRRPCPRKRRGSGQTLEPLEAERHSEPSTNKRRRVSCETCPPAAPLPLHKPKERAKREATLGHPAKPKAAKQKAEAKAQKSCTPAGAKRARASPMKAQAKAKANPRPRAAAKPKAKARPLGKASSQKTTAPIKPVCKTKAKATAKAKASSPGRGETRKMSPQKSMKEVRSKSTASRKAINKQQAAGKVTKNGRGQRKR